MRSLARRPVAFPRSFRRATQWSLLAVLAAALLGVGTTVPVSGQEADLATRLQQQPVDHPTGLIPLAVTHYMTRQHFSRHALDDEISERILKQFLESLDPMKAYFYQSDIDEFQQKRHELDDLLKKKDTEFAFVVFQRYAQRVKERMKVVTELLDAVHDFAVDEEYVIDPDATNYPKDADEARDRWRRRIKYDLLLLKGDETEGKEATDQLRERYTEFARRVEQTDRDELIERFLSAMTTSFDPHTAYMSPSSFNDFRIRLGLNYQGIGAELERREGYAIIRRIIPGGAAEKAGELKAKDRIVRVGQGEDGEMVDVVKKKLSDIINLIRGQEGTMVRLGVIPDGETDVRVYKIVRARIELKDSQASSEIMEVGKKPDGSPYRVGMIELPAFYMDMEAARRNDPDFRSTTRDVARLLAKFKQEHVDAVVLDLRRNGGGSLTEAIGLSGLFIHQGTVVQVKGMEGEIQRHDDPDPSIAWDGPLVVLTSRFSASASEILAGAVKDYGRGLVVGDTSTHGKGTVQTLLDLGRQLLPVEDPPNFGALKITIQQFYRPNGASTQNLGVLSDLIVPSLSQYIARGESDLDYALEFDKIPSAKLTDYAMTGESMLTELKKKSALRIGQSEDFKKLAQRARDYSERRERKTMPLQESKFFALQKAQQALEEPSDPEDPEDPEGDAEAPEAGDSGIIRNYFVEEVLAITADYVQALNGKRAAAP